MRTEALTLSEPFSESALFIGTGRFKVGAAVVKVLFLLAQGLFQESRDTYIIIFVDLDV